MIKLLAIATLALLAAGGCGSDGSSDESPSSRSSAVSGGEAGKYILAESELPEGWRYASGEQHLGVPASCGVKLEPPSLASADTRRFTKSATGPFVIQYSFVSSDEKATAKRIDDFVKAISTCDTYEPEKDVTVSVTALTDVASVGDAFGAVNEQRVDDPTRAQDIVAFRNGATVTVLQSYSPAALADHATLSRMASAIDAKQS